LRRDALAKLAMDRWKQAGPAVATYDIILSALAHLNGEQRRKAGMGPCVPCPSPPPSTCFFLPYAVSESTDLCTELKAPAASFLDRVRSAMVNIVRASLDQFGAVSGPCYDEVYGEGFDPSAVPKYLPSVSYFQVPAHQARPAPYGSHATLSRTASSEGTLGSGPLRVAQ
jgi:hypothetical protein